MTLAAYGVVLAFAGLVMWGLSKLPARLRKSNHRNRKLIRSQSVREARHR